MKIFFLSIIVILLSSCSFPNKVFDSKDSQPNPQVLTSPSIGSGSRIVEVYLDYKCPGCMVFSMEILPLLEEYAADNQIKILYKYPLRDTENFSNFDDTQAVLCAHSFGKFQEFKKELPIAQPSIKSNKELLDKYLMIAKTISIVSSDFEECMTQKNARPRMVSDLQDFGKLGAQFLPAMTVDGKIIDRSILQDKEGFRMYLTQIFGRMDQPLRLELQRED